MSTSSSSHQPPTHTKDLISHVPPHDDEAERGVLGGVLLSNDSYFKIADSLNPDDFYRPAHKIIYQAVVDLFQKKQAVDLVTLASRIRDMEALDQVGGPPYLASLIESVPSAGNIEDYAQIVFARSIRRKVIAKATEVVGKSFTEFDSIESYIDYVEQTIFAITQTRSTQQITPIRQIVHSTFQFIEELYENDSQISGVASGFGDIDEMTSGFQKGDLFVIAARPSMGKTSLALNIAANVAIHLKKSVAIFSLEMSKEQLVLRLMTTLAQIDAHSMRTGKLKDSDWPKLTQAAGILSECNLFIDDTSGITVQEMRAKSRRLKREGKLDIIVVDYMQLMRVSGRVESREREISEISRNLKELAKELNVPLIALSQLNRALEARSDKRPMMSDLRESGAIEQDADVIAFIYRDEVYNRDSEEKGMAEIIFAKQRNGPIGVARLAWVPGQTSFKPLAPETYVPH